MPRAQCVPAPSVLIPPLLLFIENEQFSHSFIHSFIPRLVPNRRSCRSRNATAMSTTTSTCLKDTRSARWMLPQHRALVPCASASFLPRYKDCHQQHSRAALAHSSPFQCQDAAMRFICGEAFHPCFLQPVAAGVSSTSIPCTLLSVLSRDRLLTHSLLSIVVLPRPTCHSTCTNFTNACYDAFAALGQATLLPNCETISPLTLGPMYPETVRVDRLASNSSTLGLEHANLSLPERRA